MRYIITDTNPVPLTLCETDEARSAIQNVALLISTKQGTVPGYRSFGLPMEFVGMPDPVAQAKLTQEISEALDTFEPRAQFVECTLTQDPKNPGKYSIALEVEI